MWIEVVLIGLLEIGAVGRGYRKSFREKGSDGRGSLESAMSVRWDEETSFRKEISKISRPHWQSIFGYGRGARRCCSRVFSTDAWDLSKICWR
ncbi:hypothetical protein BDV09DRAFT_47905 [Aspergillus tetrazonus]